MRYTSQGAPLTYGKCWSASVANSTFLGRNPSRSWCHTWSFRSSSTTASPTSDEGGSKYVCKRSATHPMVDAIGTRHRASLRLDGMRAR